MSCFFIRKTVVVIYKNISRNYDIFKRGKLVQICFTKIVHALKCNAQLGIKGVIMHIVVRGLRSKTYILLQIRSNFTK